MANRWIPVEAEIGVQDIETTDTTQQHALGKKVRAKDTTSGLHATFIYLKGVASTIVGAVVTYDGAGQTTLLPASSSSTTLPSASVAVAMSANLATGYGWYCIEGYCPKVVKGATVTTDVALFSSSVAGALASATVSGQQIMRMKSASSVNSANTTYDTCAAILGFGVGLQDKGVQ